MNYLIRDATIVNENKIFQSDVLIKDGRIEKIAPNINIKYSIKEIDATGLYLLPGAIDDQVHFREPGLTHKALFILNQKQQLQAALPALWKCPIHSHLHLHNNC